jgi:hypothetical protein
MYITQVNSSLLVLAGHWDQDMRIQDDSGADNSRGEAKIGTRIEKKQALICELVLAVA